MLVIVEYRNIQLLLQPPLNLKTFRGGDILQIDPPKHRRNLLYCLDDLLRILGIQTYGKRVHPSKLLKQDGLPLHHRDGGLRSDIAQPKDCRAVRHHPHQVALCRVAVYIFLILKDLLARLRHSRRVGYA